jgi:hypothetical protein
MSERKYNKTLSIHGEQYLHKLTRKHESFESIKKHKYIRLIIVTVDFHWASWNLQFNFGSATMNVFDTTEFWFGSLGHLVIIYISCSSYDPMK